MAGILFWCWNDTPQRRRGQIETFLLKICFLVFSRCEPCAWPSTGIKGSGCSRVKQTLARVFKMCVYCCTSAPSAICQNSNTFIIQSNYRHFIFTHWTGDEGEWFYGEGPFSRRIVHTTPLSNFTLHNPAAVITSSEMSDRILVHPRGLRLQICPSTDFLKETFWTCISKQMYDALHYCHSWYHMASVLLFSWKTRLSFHRAVFTFRLLDSQSHSSSAAPRFNQLTKFSLRFGDMIFGFLSENALLNSFLTFFFFFTVDVAALDIQSKRSIAQQSDPSPKPGTLSLSRTKAELTRKQHCGSSFLAAVCLTVQSVIYSTHARTHTRMHNTQTQTVNTPSG